MKIHTTGRFRTMLCAVVLLVGTAVAQSADQNEAELYTPERIAGICAAFRQAAGLARSGDVAGQVAMLKHSEALVRQRVFLDLCNNTNLAKICLDPPFVRFSPWATQDRITAQVAAFTDFVTNNKDRITAASHNLTDEQLAEVQKAEADDAHILLRVIGLAKNRLDAGDKSAIGFLKALLGNKSTDIQAQALARLILATKADLYPAAGKGLLPGKVDPAVLAAKKQAWLTWWEENAATFELPVRNMVK